MTDETQLDLLNAEAKDNGGGNKNGGNGSDGGSFDDGIERLPLEKYTEKVCDV